MTSVPPGWPPEVPPADAAGWTARAQSWLLDQAPGEYRTYPMLRRQPAVLAWLVAKHVDAQVAAARTAYRVARAELADSPTQTVSEVLELLEVEGARLLALQRSVYLVADALGGRRYVPRL